MRDSLSGTRLYSLKLVRFPFGFFFYRNQVRIYSCIPKF